MIYTEEGEDRYVTETVYDRETGLPRRQWTKLNGELHSPPCDAPSQVSFDDKGRIQKLSWHKFGQDHRDNGPSSIIINPENGVHTCETFHVNGEPRDPSLGLFRIRRHPETGEIYWQGTAIDNDPAIAS